MNKKWLLAGVATIAFVIGYGVVAKAFPTPYHYGYFYNQRDTAGLEVLPPWGGPGGCQGDGLALPMWVDTAGEFTNFILCKLNGNTQNHIGAAFIISTMTGMANPNPGAAEINEFVARVNHAASQGQINFYASIGCMVPNTFYQDGPRDVGAYGGCGSSTGNAVIFSGGSTPYTIKRFCANPVGHMNPIPDDTNWAATGRSTVSNASPNPGDTITFNHYVRNSGPTSTGGYVIWSATLSHPSNATLTPGHPTGAYNAGEEKLVDTRNVVVPAGSPPGTQICEKVLWDHQSSSNATPAIGAPVCATVPHDFALTPTVTIRINNGTTPGVFAEPGDRVEFIYAVNNAGPTISQTINCNIYGRARTNYYTVTTPHTNSSDAGFVQPAHGCPRTFPLNNTSVVTETIASVPASDLNKSLCRSFFVTPASETGGTASDEKCAYIAAKPYTRAYGGDISAGNGLAVTAGSCVSNTNASLVGWNKGGTGGFAGAGAQYGLFALNRAFDFASSLYSPGGAAPPIGLSFANNGTNVGSGVFGNSWGNSMPCIPNYYAGRPSPVPGVPASVNLMSNGIYGGSGNVSLGGGNVNPGNKITVYVGGNLMITSNITYAGTWNSGNAPLFEVIVEGNIFIASGVTRIDGVYVAQATDPAGTTAGEIHTCATPANGFTQLPTSSLYTTCNQKLTVNGLFVARQIRLLRSIGSLSQSSQGEANSSATMAETFNFSPAIWMAQPTREAPGGTPDYDAIISLPPVL